MAQRRGVPLDAPIVSRLGAPAISAVGTSLVVHEWTGSGPPYMHIHRSDDEAWHVRTTKHGMYWRGHCGSDLRTGRLTPPQANSIQNICPISFGHNNLRCLTRP